MSSANSTRKAVGTVGDAEMLLNYGLSGTNGASPQPSGESRLPSVTWARCHSGRGRMARRRSGSDRRSVSIGRNVRRASQRTEAETAQNGDPSSSRLEALSLHGTWAFARRIWAGCERSTHPSTRCENPGGRRTVQRSTRCGRPNRSRVAVRLRQVRAAARRADASGMRSKTLSRHRNT